MPRVTEIAFTGYPVSNIARSRAFYEGVLQLKLSQVYEHGEKSWIEYEIAGSTFAISNFMEAPKPSGKGPSVAFEVEDFEQSIATLRENLTPFYQEPMATPVCQLAIVGDPDGNAVTIHHRLAAASP
ncbi:MAG: VOC family protein [Opitutaceae bacterium]|nr:VOC family protein [Opitutaceae bacterium]